MEEYNTSDRVVIIEANRSWLHIPVWEIWQYRDLLVQLVRRDFVSKYKQTVLGPAWFILQPLAMTLVFTLVFHRIANIPTDGIPPPLFYMSGLLAWNFFSGCMGQVGATLRSNAGIFGKVYFPRLVAPLAYLISQFFAFGLQLITFGALYLYFRYGTEASGFEMSGLVLLLMPLLWIQISMLAIGVGLLISSATAKYRDLVHALSFITQVWMYLTPVIYPLSRIPEEFRWLAILNPMTGPVETTRWLLLGEGTLPAATLIGNLIITLLVAFAGLFLFNRVERTFIDTV